MSRSPKKVVDQYEELAYSSLHRQQGNKMYKAVKKENGKYGLQRQGSIEVHGDFATLLEALEAGGIAMVANCMISD